MHTESCWTSHPGRTHLEWYADAQAEIDRPSPEEEAAFAAEVAETEAEELAREHRAGEHHDAMLVECPVCVREMRELGFTTV